MSYTFNVYCDESCHLENDHKPYMILSYISVPYNVLRISKEMLLNLKESHDVKGEIKWSEIFAHKEKFYNDLIDFFFNTELVFRSIIIKKSAIRKDENNPKYFDDFYYKMYYQLLYHKINMEYNYNIYLDIKDTLSASKARKLKDILKVDYAHIRTLQNIRSHESIFMQLTDFFMGAINYKLNVPDDEKKGKVSIVKNRLISRIEKKCNHPLNSKTKKNEEKFNQFFIELS
ncbi:DUF3800 domain-containing protein [Chitinophaga varians]|uniref:DUF3800 domain-containing protein n=1 Tax=Chitinophaga varians TaxID=2202339 RepID=A0A847RCG3_9BACT|nr:DUF3800 domain-containing protein [Chitinophaga varians]NLR64759.1 DUF3800 domain-containing protein [Chitinophaga varians]